MMDMDDVLVGGGEDRLRMPVIEMLIVADADGLFQVTEGRHWKQIYDQMGGHPGNTSAATCTRRIYEK